ncbi:MAG: Gldg family protein, partial [Anaerolineae bacterium]
MNQNRNSAARYAIIGLIVAALGCAATGLLLVVQGTVGLKLYTPTWNVMQWIGISAGVLVLGLAVYAILNPEGVRRFFTGRQARYGSNALVMAVAFLGILGVINWMAYNNPKTWDFTEDKQHTLAPQSLQALAALPGKVEAIAFYSSQTPSDTAKQLLSDFKSNSKGKFDYKFVDPNSNPVLAKQYAITGDGKIVLVMGKTSETAAFADEQDITQAMIRLISPEARTVYFLTGHGEPDINGTEATGISQIRSTLESKNYTVKSLNLAATHQIPADAKAISEAGPTNTMLPDGVTLITTFIDKGG